MTFLLLEQTDSVTLPLNLLLKCEFAATVPALESCGKNCSHPGGGRIHLYPKRRCWTLSLPISYNKSKLILNLTSVSISQSTQNSEGKEMRLILKPKHMML